MAAVCVAVFAVGLTLIPFVLGYTLEKPGTRFTGIVLNPEDSESYFAKMLEGYDGNWLYTIPFTPEDHAAAFVGGFYIALGHLARLLGLSITAMWHLARVASSLGLFLVTFGFIALFFPDPRRRWTAYSLSIFGSGLGWVLFAVNQPYWLGTFPIDFKMAEAHFFFSAMAFPHVPVGTLLIIVSFWLIQNALRDTAPTGAPCAEGMRTRRWVLALGAGAINLALAVVYPFLIYLIVLAACLYWLYLVWQARRIEWEKGFMIALMLAIPFPLVAYYAYTLMTNPVFKAWDAQAVTPSPALPHYVIAFGVMLLLGILLWRRQQNGRYTVLWFWLLAAALLIYAPLNPQRRFVQSIQAPLAILATGGLYQIVLPWIAHTRIFVRLAARPGYSRAGLERLLVFGFVLFMCMSNVYVLVRSSVTTAVEQPFPLFRSNAEIAAVGWLRARTSHSATVMGAYETGNYVAARAGNRVVLGHWAETVNWQQRFDEVSRFYNADTGDAWRRDFLSRERVAYVLVGPQERLLGGFDAERAGYLRPVLYQAGTTIYEVCSGCQLPEASK